MELRYTGSSGLQVSTLTLGTLGWGCTGSVAAFDARAAAKALAVFLDGGGTTVEVSPGLGCGAEVVGTVLGERARADVVVVARGGRWSHPGGGDVTDLSRRGLLHALDATLARLGSDHVDLWLAHGWSDDVPLAETLSALEAAQSSGRARYVGVSDQRGWQIARSATALPGMVAAALPWSLAERGVEAEAVPACASLGLGVLACDPFRGGVLDSGPRPVRGKNRGRGAADAVAAAAEGLGTSPPAVALAWLASRAEVASVVVAADSPDRVGDLLEAPTLQLPAEIEHALDEVTRTA